MRGREFGFSPDEEVRAELLKDVEAQLRTLGGPADAVIASGDIAYAGKRNEYNNASAWLDKLCNAVGCREDAVYVCPGNHDVDQDVVKESFLLQDAHDKIRSEATDFERNRALNRHLTESFARSLFYAPTAAFNAYASRYQCSFFADEDSYAWDHDLELNDGSVLRLRGINSVLLSGLHDSENTLYLGERAHTLHPRCGVEYLTICHHPPSWLLDGREVMDSFDYRARIQLFGHEHDRRIHMGRDGVKVFAGAVNPHRADPGWVPGYNIIDVLIVSENGKRFMSVEIHAREWQGRPPQFRCHEDRRHDPVHRGHFELEAWVRPERTMEAPVDIRKNSAAGGEQASAEQRQEPTMVYRELVNRFFRMSTSRKNEILGHFELFDDSEDRLLPDVERFKRALFRARDRGLLSDIAAFVGQESEDR